MNSILLRRVMRSQKISHRAMALALGMSRSTFSRKINDEDGKGFFIREASDIGHILGLTPKQMADIFFE